MRTLSKDSLAAIDTPAVLVDWPQLTINIETMAERCRSQGVGLMPHVKTHKSVEIAKLQLAAGAVGLTCSKLSEARAMLASGVKRIFLAHSLVSRAKVPALQELAGELDELIVAVTSVEQASHLEVLLSEAGLSLPCLLALDSGMDREGARSLEELQAMRTRVDHSSVLTYRGIYSHEGYTYLSTPGQVQQEAVKVAALLRAARAELGGDGELWPGCSVTASAIAGEAGLAGVRPGAYVFGDLFLTEQTGVMAWGDLALSVAVTVVDKPRAGLALIDAGTKVFSSDKNGDAPYARPLDRRDFGLSRLSEEHGFLTGAQVDELAIGEVLQLVPVHVCPVVNLASELCPLGAGELLRVAPVDARGCVR